MLRFKQMSKLDLPSLERELSELAQRHPTLPDDDLFVIWFLLARVSEEEQASANALTGASGEKGLDAVLIDDTARAVFIVQAKLSGKPGAKSEKRSDVVAFADLARALYSPEHHFQNFTETLEPTALAKVKLARERLLEREYRLQCFYATGNKVSASLAREAEEIVRQVRLPKQKPVFEVYDFGRIGWLLNNYLAGAAPPIPLLELTVERNTLQQPDPDSGIETWICSMRGDEVGRMLEVAGERIFARNIRGFLGETKVNTKIKETLEKEPGRFWYFNNGITIVCDSAVEELGQGAHVLTVTQPQIINGQQTTRVLADVKVQKARKAQVPVRVISIPHERDGGQKAYDDLVAQIVEATNWQNGINTSDLRSNDRRQIEIERDLARLDYFYARKREAKREVRKRVPRRTTVISKEDLMRAGASCLEPNLLLNKGIQKLFEDCYKQVFDRPTRVLLSQYWLFRSCSRIAWGVSVRKYGKFIACYLVWDEISSVLRSNPRHDHFVAIARGSESERVPLEQAIDIAFKALEAFFAARRGSGAKRTEANAFFKRREVFEDFEEWLDTLRGSAHARRFDRASTRLREAICE